MTDDRAPFRWHEYPVGFTGNMASAVARTLTALLIGVAGTFLLVVAVGLLGEEGVLPYDTARMLDQFTRAAMMPVLILAWAGTLGACVAQIVRDVTVSRAALHAVRAGAPITDVPTPRQVASIITPPGSGLLIWIAFHLVLFAVAAPVALWMLIDEPHDASTMVVILVVCLGGGAALIVLAVWIGRGLRASHLERRRRISDHWWPRHEQAAWTRAQYSDASARRHQGVGRSVASLMTTVGSVGIVGALLLIYVLLFITHPDAQRWPGGQAGERAELSDELERLVDAGTTVFTVSVVLSLALLVAGFVIEGILDLRERRALREALADPSAGRPAADVLLRVADPAAPLLARTLVALGAGAVVLGWTGVSLGTGGLEDFASVYDRSTQRFEALVPVASFVRNAGIVMCLAGFFAAVNSAALGRELRNQLTARWPQRPPLPRGSGDRVEPAMLGPALTP